jgi:hypothetical protein
MGEILSRCNSRLPAELDRPVGEWGMAGRKTLGAFRRYFNDPPYPMSGNVSAPGQFSQFVRGRLDLECNGRVNAPGHLRDFDLRPFKEHPWMFPNEVRDSVMAWTDGQRDVCLYAFFFRYRKNPPSTMIPVAWVLTTGCRGWPKDEQGKHLGHWAAKWDSRYYATVSWLAENLGWKPGEPWPQPPTRRDLTAQFVANADEVTLEKLGEI